MAFEALELSFRLILVAMVVAAGIIALSIVARAIEPRGFLALLARFRAPRAPRTGTR